MAISACTVSDCARVIMAMTTAVREKFSSQAVLDDALRDSIDRKQKERPRRLRRCQDSLQLPADHAAEPA